jgi:hypothetical protein
MVTRELACWSVSAANAHYEAPVARGDSIVVHGLYVDVFRGASESRHEARQAGTITLTHDGIEMSRVSLCEVPSRSAPVVFPGPVASRGPYSFGTRGLRVTDIALTFHSWSGEVSVIIWGDLDCEE